MASTNGRPAVFLDRDGTINVEVEGALADPSQLELIPGVLGALGDLRDAGYALVGITNQSAIARGWMDEQDLGRVHAALGELLGAGGVELDLLLHCPHHPTAGSGEFTGPCACRKPKPGMLQTAQGALGLDLASSWIVGDAERDLEAGRAVGCRPLLVRTGKGARELERIRDEGRDLPQAVDDLRAAADFILRAGSEG